MPDINSVTLSFHEINFTISSCNTFAEVLGTQQVLFAKNSEFEDISILSGKVENSPLVLTLAEVHLNQHFHIQKLFALKTSCEKATAKIKCTDVSGITIVIELEGAWVSTLSFGDSDDPMMTLELCYDSLQVKFSQIGVAKTQNTFEAFGVEVAPSIEFEYGGATGKSEFIGIKPRYFLSSELFKFSQIPVFETANASQDLQRPRQAYVCGSIGTSLAFFVSNPVSNSADIPEGDVQGFFENLFLGITYSVDSFYEGSTENKPVKKLFTNSFSLNDRNLKLQLHKIDPVYNLIESLVPFYKSDPTETASENDLSVKPLSFLEKKLGQLIRPGVDAGQLFPNALKILLPSFRQSLFGVIQDCSISSQGLSVQSKFHALIIRINLVKIPDSVFLGK